ncbi:MAG: ribosome hibernation-promoting factor, HPF/YfiA family, partial [Janthinobacterium lividum]
EYVETKLERVIRHFDQVIGVSVLLSVDNHKEKDRRQYAEVNLHLKGKDVFVESHHEDLYAAIDLLVDKLDRQVIKHKDRVQSHDRNSVKHEAFQAVQMQQ